MDLVQHLKTAYLESLPEADREAAGERISAFVDFCRDYLAKNPPRQIYYPPSGIGIVLANHVSVPLAPEDNAQATPGGMQPSGAIPATGLETLKDMAQGPNKSFERISGTEDKSLNSGPIDYKAQSRQS